MNKAAVSVGLLAVLAGAAWKTMQPDRVRLIVVLILGGFALRILLVSRRSG